jgi:hypothetical protein
MNTLYSDREQIQTQFNGVSTHQLQASKFNAILIVSSPRILTNQVKRSHIYDFQPNVMNEIQTLVVESAWAGKNSRLSSLLQPRSLTATAIVPNGSGIMMETDQFSEFWSFYLIIDNLEYNMDNTISIARLQNTNRMVVSGFCSEEPINTSNHGSGFTINPRSMLTPTHYMFFKLGNQGRETAPTIQFYHDHDIIVNTALSTITKNQLPIDDLGLSLLRPTDYNLSMSLPNYNDMTDSYETTSFINNETLLNGQIRNPIIDTNLNIPRNHLANILDTSIKTVSKFASQNEGMNELIDRTRNTNEKFNTSFDHINQNKAIEPINQFVFDPTQPITLQNLQFQFPTIQVMPLFIPKEAEWNVVSQVNASPDNIYASLIASAMPSIMTRCNLSEVMFRYSSWVNNPDGSQGTYEVKHFATHISVPSNLQAIAWQNFIQAIELEIFPCLLHRLGHFDVYISCQSIGYVHIDLHVLDHTSRYEPGLYETYNFLGGINTPLVGTTSIHSHNEAELVNFTNHLSISVDGLLQPEQNRLLTPYTPFNSNL